MNDILHDFLILLSSASNGLPEYGTVANLISKQGSFWHISLKTILGENAIPHFLSLAAQNL